MLPIWVFTGTVLAALGGDLIAKPELSFPRPSTVHKMQVEKHRREQEFKRLNGIVNALGGTPEHAGILQKAGREFKIDPVFLASVTFVESNFRPKAVSSKNARGMMQLSPVVLEVLGVTDPWNPHENIMAGAAYLKHCFERYGNHSDSTYLVLAAYNIGPGSVDKLMKSEAAERFVKKVLRVYNRFSDVPIEPNRLIREVKHKDKKS